MSTYRLYTGDDNQSHIEPIDFEVEAGWKSGLDVSTIAFRSTPAGNFSDWHPAPRRQFVIIVSGQYEIGLGDGSKHIFGPGSARLVEDTTGQGHTTAVIGDEPCVTATIPLADQ